MGWLESGQGSLGNESNRIVKLIFFHRLKFDFVIAQITIIEFIRYNAK